MKSIIFRGAWVRYFDGRQEAGGAFCRIHMTAEFTTLVMEAMDWEEPGSSVTDAKLGGELHAIDFILTPGDKQLAQHEIQFAIAGVEDFKVVTIEKNEVKRRELRFIVRSSAEGVAALVDNYIRRIGEHQGALKVSYTKQDALDLKEAEPEKRKPAAKAKSGCKHCDAGIPTMDNDDGTHVNGRPCNVWAKNAPDSDESNQLRQDPPANFGAPTAAERKKARQAEELKKKEAKAAPTVWPVPNEFGVYREEEATDLIFEGKKCAAQIQVLQIGPDQWIAAVSASSSAGEGYDNPLKADTEIYPSKEIAISCAAYDAANRAERSSENASTATDKKAWAFIEDWFRHQIMTYAADLPENYLDGNYSVPQMAEAAQ